MTPSDQYKKMLEHEMMTVEKTQMDAAILMVLGILKAQRMEHSILKEMKNALLKLMVT